MPKLTAATLFKASLALMMLAAGLATAFGYDRMGARFDALGVGDAMRVGAGLMQVLAAVAAGLNTVAPMVRQMYAAVIPELHIPAARSVLAHLTQLAAEGRLLVRGGGPARLSSTYDLPTG